MAQKLEDFDIALPQGVYVNEHGCVVRCGTPLELLNRLSESFNVFLIASHTSSYVIGTNRRRVESKTLFSPAKRTLMRWPRAAD